MARGKSDNMHNCNLTEYARANAIITQFGSLFICGRERARARLSIAIWNEMHSVVALNVFGQMINVEWNVKQKSISLDLHNSCV